MLINHYLISIENQYFYIYCCGSRSTSSHGATFNSNTIPGIANNTQSKKNIVHPIDSTNHPAVAFMKVRGTAARLVNRANWVAV